MQPTPTPNPHLPPCHCGNCPTPTLLFDLDRGGGYHTRVERNADGTESVVSLYCGKELERFTRPARFGAARTVES
jgi:hypothetical protein